MTKIFLYVLVIALIPLFAPAQPQVIQVTISITRVPKIDARYDLTGKIYRFEKMGWPSEVSKAQIEAAIQALVTRGYGTAFRYIGVTEDWNHGHLTWDIDSQKVIGIIFHTQEGLLPYFLLDSPNLYVQDGLLNGLDRSQRSWIYFFESNDILNLKTYALQEKPDSIDLELWNAWTRLGSYRPENVDPKKIGKHLGYEDKSQRDSIHFYRMNCPAMTDLKYENSNVIKIRVNNENVCLYLVNDFCNAQKHFEDHKYCIALE